MTAAPVTRRQFLKVTAASVQPKPWTAQPQGVEINAWLAIDA